MHHEGCCDPLNDLHEAQLCHEAIHIRQALPQDSGVCMESGSDANLRMSIQRMLAESPGHSVGHQRLKDRLRLSSLGAEIVEG